MDFNKLQDQLDELYIKQDLDQVYMFLIEKTYEAMELQNDEIVLFLLNEMLGYYRVTAKFNEGNQIIMQMIKIIEYRNLNDTISAATTFLNIATFYRVEGEYDKSLQCYLKTEKIYRKNLKENDERYGAFYNNLSLLYMEIGEYDKALEYGLKALSIMTLLENSEVEQAISNVNIAQMFYSKNNQEKGLSYLNKGIEMFEKYAPHDPHYFAALSTLARQYYLEKKYQKAIDLYEDILIKIENVYGKNKDYDIVLKNKQEVENQFNDCGIKGIDLCEEFYLTYGKKMIESKFKDIQQYMAIGLFGFGSECLGYDDELSQDHDFGPGFCILLPNDIYKKYGEDLQKEYDLLPKQFKGYQRLVSREGKNRVGVFEISAFFHQFLYQIPTTLQQWLYADENALLAVTNGKIFDDHYGEVTRLRQQLSYYPEDIRKKKLVRAIAKMAQSGQYNYARCAKRGQEVAAFLALSEFIDQTLSCLYLLNKKYKPYYKWSFYGLKDCEIGKKVKFLLEELINLSNQKECWDNNSPMLNKNDQKIIVIEKICQFIVKELQKQGLTSLNDDFLDNHVYEIMSHIQDENIRSKHIMEG